MNLFGEIFTKAFLEGMESDKTEENSGYNVESPRVKARFQKEREKQEKEWSDFNQGLDEAETIKDLIPLLKKIYRGDKKYRNYIINKLKEAEKSDLGFDQFGDSIYLSQYCGNGNWGVNRWGLSTYFHRFPSNILRKVSRVLRLSKGLVQEQKIEIDKTLVNEKTSITSEKTEEESEAKNLVDESVEEETDNNEDLAAEFRKSHEEGFRTEFEKTIDDAKTFEDIIDIISSNPEEIGGQARISEVKKTIDDLTNGNISPEEVRHGLLFDVSLKDIDDRMAFLNSVLRDKIVQIYKLQKVRVELNVEK